MRKTEKRFYVLFVSFVGRVCFAFIATLPRPLHFTTGEQSAVATAVVDHLPSESMDHGSPWIIDPSTWMLRSSAIGHGQHDRQRIRAADWWNPIQFRLPVRFFVLQIDKIYSLGEVSVSYRLHNNKIREISHGRIEK